MQNVTFVNCKISAQRGLVIQNAKDVDVAGLDLKVAQGEPIINRDVAPPQSTQPSAPPASPRL